jgi:hypothetical protein
MSKTDKEEPVITPAKRQTQLYMDFYVHDPIAKEKQLKEGQAAICKHCDRVIKWSEIFGWYHGVMGAGWNTTCLDGALEMRAEPDMPIQEPINATDDIVAPGLWFGPPVEVLAEWEKNKEALEYLDEDDDIIPDDKVLHHGDIPVIMGILMDRLNVTRFEFSYEEMLEFKGKVVLDQPDSRKSSYIMVRQGRA